MDVNYRTKSGGYASPPATCTDPNSANRNSEPASAWQKQLTCEGLRQEDAHEPRAPRYAFAVCSFGIRYWTVLVIVLRKP